MFLQLIFEELEKVTNSDILYQRITKVLPGIDPGKTLPEKENLLAQYYPNDIKNKS